MKESTANNVSRTDSLFNRDPLKNIYNLFDVSVKFAIEEDITEDDVDMIEKAITGYSTFLNSDRVMLKVKLNLDEDTIRKVPDILQGASRINFKYHDINGEYTFSVNNVVKYLTYEINSSSDPNTFLDFYVLFDLEKINLGDN